MHFWSSAAGYVLRPTTPSGRVAFNKYGAAFTPLEQRLDLLSRPSMSTGVARPRLPGRVYGRYPFDPFAIVYTALAWHAVVAVGLGLVLLHQVLANGRVAGAISVLAGLGALWGLWAATLACPRSSATPSRRSQLAAGAPARDGLPRLHQPVHGHAGRPQDLVAVG
jgi:hypothetical protein